MLCFRLGDKFHLILKAAETTLPSFGHFWQLHPSKSFTIYLFSCWGSGCNASFNCWSSCLRHIISARVEQQRSSRVPEPCEVAAGNLPTEALLMLLWWGADTWAGFEVRSRYLGRRKNTPEWASWWEFIDTPSILWLKQRFFLLVTLIFFHYYQNRSFLVMCTTALMNMFILRLVLKEKKKSHLHHWW